MNHKTGPLHLFLMGPPGSGKGTQSEFLVEQCGYHQFSTGDLLRREIRSGSGLGREIDDIISEGHLVPDSMMIRMLEPHLALACAAGEKILLDGFPRTLPQLEWLNEWFARHDLRWIGIVLELRPQVIIERLSGRLVCPRCGAVFHRMSHPPIQPGICDRCDGRLIAREDDTRETILERFEVYHKATEPVIDRIRALGRLEMVPADSDPQKIHYLVRQAVDKAAGAC